MESLKDKKDVNIQYACNGGEVKLRCGSKLLKVDGYCRETNTVYQFHGCYYQGCPKCYPNTLINSRSNGYMTDLYSVTLKNDELLRQHYNLITIWEHVHT
jgi:hypothetical protein